MIHIKHAWDSSAYKACLWVHKASCQAGGRRGGGGTKSSTGAAKLCTAPCYQTQDTPLLFTSHNWVHTKKVSVQRGCQVTRWRLWNSQIKRVPSAHPRSACQKGLAAFLSLPLLSLSPPPTSPHTHPRLLLPHWLTKNKALGSAGLLQQAGSSHWINQGKTARWQWIAEGHNWGVTTFIHRLMCDLTQNEPRERDVTEVSVKFRMQVACDLPWSVLFMKGGCFFFHQCAKKFLTFLSGFLFSSSSLTARDKDNSATGVGVHWEQCLSSKC